MFLPILITEIKCYCSMRNIKLDPKFIDLTIEDKELCKFFHIYIFIMSLEI